MRTNFKIILTSLVFTTTGVALWYVTSKIYQPNQGLTTINVTEVQQHESIPTPLPNTPVLVTDTEEVTDSSSLTTIHSAIPTPSTPTASQTQIPSAALSSAGSEARPGDIPKTLMGSDGAMVNAVEKLSDTFAAWLTPDQQIRKWVFVTDTLAKNNIPIQDRPLSYDVEKFSVESSTDENVFYLSKVNFQRADLLITTLTQIPPQQAVKQYQRWQPLFEQAYAEIGGENFTACLLQAIDNILAVQPIDTKPRLKQPVVFYTYADQKLESAPRLHKFLWRMGPENSLKLQTYLGKIRDLLE